MPGSTRGTLVLALVITTGCIGADEPSSAPEVVRSDSAGIAIVESRGGDRALDWRFTEVLRLGGADQGPEAFYQPMVDTDARGRIYVLSRGEHEVIVFDSTGRHLRTFGRKGGGPGEMERPARIAVTAAGIVGVQDWGKGAVVRWDSAGEPMAQLPLTAPMLWGLEPLGDGFAAEYARLSGFGAERDSTSFTLVRMTEAGAPLALLIRPSSRACWWRPVARSTSAAFACHRWTRCSRRTCAGPSQASASFSPRTRATSWSCAILAAR